MTKIATTIKGFVAWYNRGGQHVWFDVIPKVKDVLFLSVDIGILVECLRIHAVIENGKGMLLNG